MSQLGDSSNPTLKDLHRKGRVAWEVKGVRGILIPPKGKVKGKLGRQVALVDKMEKKDTMKYKSIGQNCSFHHNFYCATKLNQFTFKC